MTTLWIILGIFGYFLIGILLFTIVDVWRMTITGAGYKNTFKLNLLDILNDYITSEHAVGIIFGRMFWPVGIVVCIIMVGWYYFDRIVLDKIRGWCEK